MWILSQLLYLAGQITTIIPVFSGPVVCAFPELFHQFLSDELQIHFDGNQVVKVWLKDALLSGSNICHSLLEECPYP